MVEAEASNTITTKRLRATFRKKSMLHRSWAQQSQKLHFCSCSTNLTRSCQLAASTILYYIIYINGFLSRETQKYVSSSWSIYLGLRPLLLIQCFCAIVVYSLLGYVLALFVLAFAVISNKFNLPNKNVIFFYLQLRLLILRTKLHEFIIIRNHITQIWKKTNFIFH